MEVYQSAATVRRKFVDFFGKDPPSRLTIRRICKKFKKLGTVQDQLMGAVGRKRYYSNL
jgi:hypothetical protein